MAGLATGRYDLLRYLTVDRIHEPYRAAAYPQFPRLIAAAREAGALGACLSGAGSTILAFADSMAGITRIEAAFGAAAADIDLPGRVAVVEPQQPRREGDQPFDGLRLRPLAGSAPQPVRLATNARILDQASSLASANSAALRSKKLCGAPG